MVVAFWDLYVRQVLEKLHTICSGKIPELFSDFNSKKKGFLNKEDFKELLGTFNNELKDFEVEMFFDHFDSDRTKQITLLNFQKGFMALGIK